MATVVMCLTSFTDQTRFRGPGIHPNYIYVCNKYLSIFIQFYTHRVHVWYIYIYLPTFTIKNHPNVEKYTIHGSYGIYVYIDMFIYMCCPERSQVSPSPILLVGRRFFCGKERGWNIFESCSNVIIAGSCSS